MSAPLVSVITPLYNCEKYVSGTIQSVIDQTFTHWEMLITDDKSTDKSYSVAQSWLDKDDRIKLFQLEENRGAAAARNHSIEHATGRYIAFLDSDDRWMPQKLEKQIKFMTDNDYPITYTRMEVVSESGEKKNDFRFMPKVYYQKMLCKNHIPNSTAVYDTSHFGKVYAPNLRKRQDYAMWLYLLRQVPYAYGLGEVLCIYTERKESVSSNKLRLLKDNYQMFRNTQGFSVIKSLFLVSINAFEKVKGVLRSKFISH